MKENKKNPVNNQHIYGFIENVRFGETQDGKTGINMLVSTMNHSDKKPRSHHNVKMFTTDPEVIAQYKAVAADLEQPKAERQEHRISLDGSVVNGTYQPKDADKPIETVEVLTRPDKVDLDAKLAENEKRNRLDLICKVGSINLSEEKGVAVVRVANNFYPSDSSKEKQTTWLTAYVNENSIYTKKAYEAIKKGEFKQGDSIVLGGQLHDRTKEIEVDGRKLHRNDGHYVNVTTFSRYVKKEAQTQAQEAAQAQKPAEKPAQKPAEAKTPQKKVGSRKNKKVGQSL